MRVTRNGKIAGLRRRIRDELNQRLDDSQEPQNPKWGSRRTGDVIPAAHFLRLAYCQDGSVHGVHLINGVGGLFESTTGYEFPETNPADHFQARSGLQFGLRPWSEDDDRWLDRGQR